MNKHGILLAALTLCLASGSRLGAQVGDPAPPLKAKEWIQGQPVEIKAGTNIYVLEIFTSTSSASRASTTNLNAIRKRFKDRGVVVVGVSDELPEKIKEFVAQAKPPVDYAIAADDQHQTSRSYMLPVWQRGVPYAFVVGKDGKLLWHGHPMGELENVLEQITTGRYDTERKRKADAAGNQMRQYLILARRGDVRAGLVGRRLLSLRADDVPLLCDLAFQVMTDPQIAKRDISLAGQALDQAEKLAPTNATRVATARAIWLFETGNQEDGLARARQALASAKDAREKASAAAGLRTMEARLQAAKTSQTNNPAGKP